MQLNRTNACSLISVYASARRAGRLFQCGLTASILGITLLSMLTITVRPVLAQQIQIAPPPPSLEPQRLSPTPAAAPTPSVRPSPFPATGSRGQEAPASANSAPQERRASKPAVEEKKVDGDTFVELDRLLVNVYGGRAPQSLAELKALEAQQSKVAAAIQRVTVNVRQGAAQGSGVLISDNYVLTAAHVGGKPGRSATVYLSDGTDLKAEVLGMNRNVDAGLLRITDTQGKQLPYATLGKSAGLRTGQWVIGSGHPGGWQSGRGAVIRVGRILNVMSDTLISDVALIGGDSGGPLFNLRGELIGIHSRIGTDVVDNMHVPIDTFQHDWRQLQDGVAWGTLPGYRPIIGVHAKENETQAIVGRIEDDSPAYRAGLLVGDVIVRFDGQPIANFEELQNAVRATLPGDVVKVEVKRDGATVRLMIVVGVDDK